VHLCLFKAAIEQFGVSATAIDVLLVLDRKLNDEGFVLIAESWEFRAKAIEFGILRRLNTNILFGLPVELSRSQYKFAGFSAFLRRLDPAIQISRIERLLEVDSRFGDC